MRRSVFCLGILLFLVLVITGMSLVIRYGNDIPSNLTPDEMINPTTGQRYNPTEVSDLIAKKRNASLEFKLTLVGAAMFGICFVLLGSVLFCTVCCGITIQFDSDDVIQPHQVAPLPAQALPLDSTNPLQKSSQSTTDVPPPTSAPSPHVTFRVQEPPPRLDQMTLV